MRKIEINVIFTSHWLMLIILSFVCPYAPQASILSSFLFFLKPIVYSIWEVVPVHVCTASCKLQRFMNTKRLMAIPCCGSYPQIYRQVSFITKPSLIFKDSEKYLLDHPCNFPFACSHKHAFGYNEMYKLDRLQ